MIEYVAQEDIARGDVIALGDRCGIAYNNAKSGETVPVYVKGRFSVEAKTGTAITAGAKLYYDTESGTVSAAADGVYIGFAACKMEAARTHVDVILA